MTNSTYFLSTSVEAGRLAAAENYYNLPSLSSPPPKELPFDLFPEYKEFKVILPRPAYLPLILVSYECQDYGLKHITSVMEFPRGSGNYVVRAKPYATTEQVSSELEALVIPF
jgi:hypothetical protein